MLYGLTIGLTIAQQQGISTSQDVYKFNFRKQDNLQTTTYSNKKMAAHQKHRYSLVNDEQKRKLIEETASRLSKINKAANDFKRPSTFQTGKAPASKRVKVVDLPIVVNELKEKKEVNKKSHPATNAFEVSREVGKTVEKKTPTTVEQKIKLIEEANSAQAKMNQSVDFKRPSQLVANDSIIKVKMTIDPDVICFVAGYKMSNAKRLEKIHQVEIYIPGYQGASEITVKGPAVNVYAAQVNIAECLPYEARFPIDKEHIETVLGPNGEEKRAMFKAHNVLLSIHEDKEVVITGKLKGCEAAKKAIESRINAKKIDEAYQETLFVTGDQMKLIAGEDDSKSSVKRIKSTFGVSLIVDSSRPPEYGRYGIGLKGPSAELVSAAKKDILDNLPCVLIFTVDERFIKKTLIPRTKEKFGVEIFLKEGKANVSGKKGSAEAAKEAIIASISAKRKRTEACASPISNKRKKNDVVATP